VVFRETEAPVLDNATCTRYAADMAGHHRIILPIFLVAACSGDDNPSTETTSASSSSTGVTDGEPAPVPFAGQCTDEHPYCEEDKGFFCDYARCVMGPLGNGVCTPLCSTDDDCTMLGDPHVCLEDRLTGDHQCAWPCMVNSDCPSLGFAVVCWEGQCVPPCPQPQEP
jgi:hypothetical protein